MLFMHTMITSSHHDDNQHFLTWSKYFDSDSSSKNAKREFRGRRYPAGGGKKSDLRRLDGIQPTIPRPKSYIDLLGEHDDGASSFTYIKSGNSFRRRRHASDDVNKKHLNRSDDGLPKHSASTCHICPL